MGDTYPEYRSQYTVEVRASIKESWLVVWSGAGLTDAINKYREIMLETDGTQARLTSPDFDTLVAS